MMEWALVGAQMEAKVGMGGSLEMTGDRRKKTSRAQWFN